MIFLPQQEAEIHAFHDAAANKPKSKEASATTAAAASDEELHSVDACDVLEREIPKRVSSDFKKNSNGWNSIVRLQEEPEERQESEEKENEASKKSLCCPPSLFSTQKRGSNRISKKMVRFSNVHIREYPIVIGVNPGGMDGVPLTISWEYVSEVSVPVVAYECAVKNTRRSKNNMVMTPRHRESLLLDLGCELSELKWGAEEARVVRDQRRQTQRRMFASRTCERLQAVREKVTTLFKVRK